MNARVCLPLLAILFAACIPQGPPVPDNPCDFAGAGDHTLTLNVDGRDWATELHVPSSVDVATPVPLVIVLHGTAESGRDPLVRNGWLAASNDQGFIVAAPDALPLRPDEPANPLTNPRVWNNGQPLPDDRTAINDVRFFDALLDKLATCIN